jgi:hypothetical protein
MLNIAYITGRKDNRIEWFCDSLLRQGDALNCWDDIKVIVIDRFYDQRDWKDPFGNLYGRFIHMAPKPNVWQGKHRLTKQDYFAVANARNTALCLAGDGYIAYVDDLSVLMPEWLSRVRTAQAENNIYMGAYKKVHNLKVEDGIAVSWDELPTGIDSRWNTGNDTGPVPSSGSALFGCSMAVPVQAFLNINGWDEDCDCCGLGGEDSMAGIMLAHQKWPIFYDRRMLTLESEELHHVEDNPIRKIETKPGSKDASWVMLEMVQSGNRNRAPNYFGEGGISDLRQRVLHGEPFPIMKIPEHNWFTGKPLFEL